MANTEEAKFLLGILPSCGFAARRHHLRSCLMAQRARWMTPTHRVEESFWREEA
jgi:hypothetical protein